MIWLGLFVVGFAVVYWLLLCLGSWTVDGVFELYPGAKRRRRVRQTTEYRAPLNRPVTLCGCNDCINRRKPA